MDDGLISRRYAKALFRYAGEQETQRSIYEKMKLFQENEASHPSLRKALLNPMLPAKTKENLLAAATGIQADGRDAHALRLLFRLLIRNHREMHTRGIATMYEEIYRAARGIARVKVTTAVPLSPAMHDKVETFIRERAGASLEFTYKIDPAIVGGIILEVGSQRYDASVSQKLREIRAGFLKK